MTLIGNILKVVGVIIVGCIVGYFLGSILGAVFGIIASFLVPDVFTSHQATLISFFISALLGVSLSSFATRVYNRLNETNINLFLGVIPGVLIGLFVVVFVYGYVEVYDQSDFYRIRASHRLAVTPIMGYSAKVGGYVGAVTFALFGAVGVVHEIIQSHLQLQRNRELMKNSPPMSWGYPETPKRISPVQISQTTNSSPPLQSRMNFQKGGKIIILLRAFVSAVVVGIILSVVGWQILGWSSSAQFSEGLFWTSLLLAVYGYVSFSGRHRGSRTYSESAGVMDLEERNRFWSSEAENIFERLPYIIPVSVWLFVFAGLISIIF